MIGTASFDDYFAEKVLSNLEKNFNDPTMQNVYPPLEGSFLYTILLHLFLFLSISIILFFSKKNITLFWNEWIFLLIVYFSVFYYYSILSNLRFEACIRTFQK